MIISLFLIIEFVKLGILILFLIKSVFIILNYD